MDNKDRTRAAEVRLQTAHVQDNIQNTQQNKRLKPEPGLLSQARGILIFL